MTRSLETPMPSKTKPAYQRWLQRRDWARARGIKSTAAAAMASNIPSFRDFAREEGFDPDTLGDFARSFACKGSLREVQP